MVAVPIGISCIAFMSVLDYAKEMLIIYQRRFRFETGTITKKKRSRYEIETLQLSNAQPSNIKKEKRSTYCLGKGLSSNQVAVNQSFKLETKSQYYLRLPSFYKQMDLIHHGVHMVVLMVLQNLILKDMQFTLSWAILRQICLRKS